LKDKQLRCFYTKSIIKHHCHNCNLRGVWFCTSFYNWVLVLYSIRKFGVFTVFWPLQLSAWLTNVPCICGEWYYAHNIGLQGHLNYIICELALVHFLHIFSTIIDKSQLFSCLSNLPFNNCMRAISPAVLTRYLTIQTCACLVCIILCMIWIVHCYYVIWFCT